MSSADDITAHIARVRQLLEEPDTMPRDAESLRAVVDELHAVSFERASLIDERNRLAAEVERLREVERLALDALVNDGEDFDAVKKLREALGE